MFHPRIIDTIREGYSFEFLKKDFLSGLTVAVVAVPLSIAFAIASGATPIIGILTAIIGGLLVSLFGGSKFNISGPAGAFIGVIYITIAHYGYNGMLISTFIAGLFIMLFAMLKLGKLVKLIPNCIIIGFSIGLGIDILSGQMADFLGLQVHGGENFAKKITICTQNIKQFQIPSIITGTITIITTIIVRKIKKSLPSFLIAICFACVISKIFGLQSETINNRFGVMHLLLPEFHQSIIDEVEHPSHIFQYIPSALTIAILSSVEALLAATIADKMTGGYHRPNTEMFSLGFANCVSALFGCIPIAGTTARTIVNVSSGAKSPFSGVFHGLFLIILMAVFANLIGEIHMSVIAGILIVVATDMMSIKKAINLIKTSAKFDVIIMLLTAIFVLTNGIVFAIIVNTTFYRVMKKLQFKKYRKTR